MIRSWLIYGTSFWKQVKWWVTINEPLTLSLLAYGMAVFPPAVADPFKSLFLAIRNMLRAHVKAYRVYNNLFKATQKGKVTERKKSKQQYGLVTLYHI